MNANRQESDTSLHLLSDSELEMTQNITLMQTSEEPKRLSLFLLSRVWHGLEQERRRRRSEVRELEQIYFARRDA
jgi:hypothetical protein